MKSCVQLNFIELRAIADRALSQLIRMVREETEALSSREQGGIYQLEAMLSEESSDVLPVARVGLGSAFATRWMAFASAVATRWTAFSTVMVTLALHLSVRSRAYGRGALARARVAWGWRFARLFVAVRVALAHANAKLRKLWPRHRFALVRAEKVALPADRHRNC